MKRGQTSQDRIFSDIVSKYQKCKIIFYVFYNLIIDSKL